MCPSCGFLIVSQPFVCALPGGQHHTLILTNNGDCQVIGRKDYGRLGLGKVEKDVTKISQIKSLSGRNVIQVACGESCSFARTKDGKVYAWGIGSNNQLGVGSEEDVYEPILLSGAQVKNKEVLNVNSGGQHTLFLVSEEDAVQQAETEITATKKIEQQEQPAVANGTTTTENVENGKTSTKPIKKAVSKKK